MDFDINLVRAGVTTAGLVLFVALVLHTWSRRRRAEHAEAAALIFQGSEEGEAP